MLKDAASLIAVALFVAMMLVWADVLASLKAGADLDLQQPVIARVKR